MPIMLSNWKIESYRKMGTYVERRSLQEIAQTHKLEPSLKTIYVEGITDKFFIESFLESENISDITIYEIDTINFQEIYDKVDVRRNCKKKVIVLSNELADKLEKSAKVLCVIDTDFDLHLNTVKQNLYLKYTDYNSIELYCFNHYSLKKILKELARINTIDVNAFTERISLILRQIFFLRLKLQEINPEYTLPDIKRNIKVDQSSYYSFDIKEYIKKTVTQNKLYDKLNEFIKEIDFNINNTSYNPRVEIRGHDYICVLQRYIEKQNKKIGLTEEALGIIIFNYCDYKNLVKEPLFSTIKLF